VGFGGKAAVVPVVEFDIVFERETKSVCVNWEKKKK